MTLRIPKSAGGAPTTPRKNKKTLNPNNELQQGVWKIWILVALEGLLFYGLVGFAYEGISTGAFSATELGEVCARVLGYALVFVVLQVKKKII